MSCEPQIASTGRPKIDEGHVLNIDKPLGWTSADVVRKVKFALQRAGLRKLKVGHAGTLDPLATGVLLVCLGRATKRVEELQNGRKEYVAEVTFGGTTPSYDLEHAVDQLHPWEHITREAVEAALVALSGERLQTPPIFSAKKIEGARAYELAREGAEVQMRQALIHIYGMELLVWEEGVVSSDGGTPSSDKTERNDVARRVGTAADSAFGSAPDLFPRAVIRVECSKGTYIRSLAHELGAAVGSGAHLSGLRRTRSGDFTAASAQSIEQALLECGV